LIDELRVERTRNMAALEFSGLADVEFDQIVGAYVLPRIGYAGMTLATAIGLPMTAIEPRITAAVLDAFSGASP
jgi:hypothetical protein